MSCSQVIAIPPCIWTASAATFENASLAATRASAADVADGLGDRVVDDGPRGLHRDVQVGHPVLERLETADRPAELHAVLGVFDGQIQTLRGGADLLGGQQDRRGVGEAGVGADVRGVLGLDPRESTRQVHGVDAVRGEVRPAAQRRAVGGDHDVGDVAVDHVTGVEHHGPDRCALGQPFQRVGVGLVGGQQREFGERGA